LDAAGAAADATVLAVAGDVLRRVRRAKSEAKRSMRAEVRQVVVTDLPERLHALAAAAGDLRSAGHVGHLRTQPVADAALADVTVELAAGA
jgi:valyl-tRNA synthetase